ncbi:Cro/CI family transcriptional regulator [Aeromonas dhakensis]|uniref:Cro/CI family transcriptional regulator n=1 Tax=Aeromonas dhakensis TaxID=196024 RepID=UPI003B9DF69C
MECDEEKDVIDHFGGANKLAQALGCKPQAISQWSEFVPKGLAYQIEVLTDGKLKADSRSTPQQPTTCV